MGMWPIHMNLSTRRLAGVSCEPQESCSCAYVNMVKWALRILTGTWCQSRAFWDNFSSEGVLGSVWFCQRSYSQSGWHKRMTSKCFHRVCLFSVAWHQSSRCIENARCSIEKLSQYFSGPWELFLYADVLKAQALRNRGMPNWYVHKHTKIYFQTW